MQIKKLLKSVNFFEMYFKIINLSFLWSSLLIF